MRCKVMGFLNFYSFSSCLTINCNKSRYLRVWKSLEKVSLRTTTFKAFASLLTRLTLRSLYKNKTNNKLHVLNINQKKRKSFSFAMLKNETFLVYFQALWIVEFNVHPTWVKTLVDCAWRLLYVGVERTLKKENCFLEQIDCWNYVF